MVKLSVITSFIALRELFEKEYDKIKSQYESTSNIQKVVGQRQPMRKFSSKRVLHQMASFYKQ